MNSEAIIPSTMAQKKDAITPMLMKMIAARSLGTEFKNSLYHKLNLWNLILALVTVCAHSCNGGKGKAPLVHSCRNALWVINGEDTT